MKVLFASDIHGSAGAARALLEAYSRHGAQRLILLGDILYHGPRNPVPLDYDPQGVAALLNELQGVTLGVQGNCDAQIDQMLLEFPMSAEYMLIQQEDVCAFATHGHLYNERQLPPMGGISYIIHGHTHVRARVGHGKYTYLNPGSVSMPKGDGIAGYMTLAEGKFSFFDMRGNRLEA